jgi:hypothetical protein
MAFLMAPALALRPSLGFVPNADDEQRVERNRLPLHQRVDFLLLLFHDGEQRDFLFAGVVAGHAVVFLFLLVDFLGDGQRINIDRDGVIEQPQIGEPLDDAGIGRARPAGQRDDGVIMAVQEEAEIGLAVAFAVPAIFLNGKFGHKIRPPGRNQTGRPATDSETVCSAGNGRGRSWAACARRPEPKISLQQPVNVVELGFQLVEQRQVILAQGGVGLEAFRGHVSSEREM